MSKYKIALINGIIIFFILTSIAQRFGLMKNNDPTAGMEIAEITAFVLLLL
jgi:hypothetical protein